MSNWENNMAYLPGDCETATPVRTRSVVSGAVSWAWEHLKARHARLLNAVDLGCGKGRNTLFLARKGLHVTAMDFAPNAIDALQKSAIRQKLHTKIRAFVQDINEDWPLKSDEADLVVDTFCFKHLSSKEEYESYKKNLLRILSVGGHYLLSFNSIGDGYYGSYMRTAAQPAMPVDDAVKIDPINGVESTLFSREKAIEFFGPELEVFAELKSNESDGNVQRDGTYALLFHRAPKWFYS
ncbi:MAG: class I SAM-dependent methyltransferase [Alphaproteobacteria bacterium]